MTLTLRSAKGSELTHAELDANFQHVQDRANHTGTQATSTITGLDAALAAKLTNPMTAAGELIVGGSGGAPTRLPLASTDGYVLTRVAGAVAWAAATGGMTNPMTGVGDLIIGGAIGAPARLAPGTNGYVLTLVSGSPAWQPAGGGSFTGGTLTSALNEAPIVTLASAATTDIGAAAANTLSISGTTTITSLGTIASGAERSLVFQGALTLTHNATSLILPTGANITTAAGDVAEFVSLGSGNWRCVGYLRANGQALASSGGGGGLTNLTEAKNTASPNAGIPAVSLAVTVAESNGDIALVPKGAGSLAAQVPTGTAAGGNKRGNYANDLQRGRAVNTSVANGSYSAIMGGYDNTASGAHTFVGGGQGNSALSDHSSVLGGQLNTAINAFTSVLGGYGNTASGGHSCVLGGDSNGASGQYAAVLGGMGNAASGILSQASGGYATTRGIYGAVANAAGRFTQQGDAQRARFVLRRATTNDTATELSADGGAPAAATRVVLPNNSAYGFTGRLVARAAATGDCASWEFKGTIRRGANAAATALVAAVTPSLVAGDAGASAWAVSVTADTTNGALAVTVTGVAATNIRWVADVETVEVVG